MYAYVVFPIAHYQQFIYRIPPDLVNQINEGICIKASFRNKSEFGFVVSTQSKTSFKNKIKIISEVADSSFQISDELWKTIIFLSQYYICPIGIVLKTAIPLLFKNYSQPKKKIYCQITEKGHQAISNWGSKAPKQLEFLKLLMKSTKEVSLVEISKIIKSYNQIYQKLLEKEMISIILKNDLIIETKNLKRKKIILNNEQDKVFNEITNSIKLKKYSPYLLHGVTGSGKTEVYIKLANQAINNKQSIIILVPEISLTPQLSEKFINTFGDKVALWHSKLTTRQKYQTWHNLKNNQYSIIIGARSAIFTPIKNIGLIIIDEEHDSSYKQEVSSFKYHARDVAIIRAKYSNSTIVLGSATPSIESYYNAINKKFKLVEINSRYQNSKFPSVNIIDMKKGKNRFSYDFSYDLIHNMKQSLKNNEQIIILHNRRGFSTICRCEDCGEIGTCTRCSISLTYHSNGELICHYCSKSYYKISNCQSCNSLNINFIGAGTQKIEFEINKLFPDAKIARMDFDTMKNYNNYKNILNDFSNQKYDILLGTQMVSKGLDFNNVTLVGVINGDTGLYIPDFRSGERTFQLLYQVCGRAGRNNKSSKAIIQSWNTDNIFIQLSAKLDISNYYNISLSDRKKLGYPPFSKFIRIVITGNNKEAVKRQSNSIKKKLNIKSIEGIVLGPSIAPIEKINNNWRYHILIKAKKKYLSNIYNHISKNIGFNTFHDKKKNEKIEIEIDPISIL